MRFSLGQFGIASTAFATVALVLVVVAGDYARVQFLRLKHFLSYKQALTERDALLDRRHSLRREIAELEAERDEALRYRKRVAGRVDELRSIIQTARLMGLTIPDYLDSEGVPVDIGGAELDCDEFCLQELALESELFERPSAELLQEMESMIEFMSELPLGSPVEGHLSSGYGYRRSPFSKTVKMHAGLDYSAGTGASIRATADGKVKKVWRSSAYGLVVDIQHSHGIVTRFAHLSRAFVKKGEEICRGQEIALVGSTGRSTGPHLHYEVRSQGKALNPVFFVGLAEQLARTLPASAQASS